MPSIKRSGSLLGINQEIPDSGEPELFSTETLMPQVYDELRRLAKWHMQREAAGQTLTGTALLHEAYLRLKSEADGPQWQNQRQFFSAAAEAMRRFLIDRVRAKHRLKRGGDQVHTTFDEMELDASESDERLLAVDEALDQLALADPESAELVKLRFFAGFTLEEIAESMGISVRTVTRQWTYARAWLARHLEQDV